MSISEKLIAQIAGITHDQRETMRQRFLSLDTDFEDNRSVEDELKKLHRDHKPYHDFFNDPNQ